MNKYFLEGSEQIAITETQGAIGNLSNVTAEITDDGGSGIILYPKQHMSFSGTIYARRAAGECGVAVLGVLTATNATGGGNTGGGDSCDCAVADENDIAKIFDKEAAEYTKDSCGCETADESDIINMFGKDSQEGANDTTDSCGCETADENDIKSLFGR